jgi:hypothetical protein
MTDPDISPLQQAASSAHEMFTTMVGAGFTEDQALRLIAYWLVELGKGGTG